MNDVIPAPLGTKKTITPIFPRDILSNAFQISRPSKIINQSSINVFYRTRDLPISVLIRFSACTCVITDRGVNLDTNGQKFCK